MAKKKSEFRSIADDIAASLLMHPNVSELLGIEPQPKQLMALKACGLDEAYYGGTIRPPESDRIGYGGAAGGGKRLSVNTDVATPHGWLKLGDIEAGDEVFGMDGKPKTVLHVHPVVIPPTAFRLTFDDGASIEADGEHLWLTYDAKELAALTRKDDNWRARRRATRPTRGKGKRPDVVLKNSLHHAITDAPRGTIRTTQEIADSLFTKSGRRNHAIPVSSPLQLLPCELPLDPYLVGVWLGDGTTKRGVITTSDPEILDAFVMDGFTVKYRSKYDYYVKELVPRLRKAGVFGNKHVPPLYLRASVEQRLALLQGLMDTDGTACKSGAVEFTSTKRALADGCAELVRSLGYKVAIQEHRAKLYGKDYGPNYRLKWTADKPMFRLQRKLSRQNMEHRRRTGDFRYIVACDPIVPTPMRCLTVDATDGMWLCGESMIPTHNTWTDIMISATIAVHVPGAQIGVFRRTCKELEQADGFIPQSKILFRGIRGVSYHETRREWTFPNGSKIFFCYCDGPQDMYNYDSSQFYLLIVDEATHMPYGYVEYLGIRNRSTCIPIGMDAAYPFTMLSSNPGKIGHGWFKALFIQGIQPFVRTFGKIPTGEKVPVVFIPSKLSDNQILRDKDPNYEKKLDSLNPTLRAMMRDGDWDVAGGLYFAGFLDPEVHVVENMQLDPTWRIYGACDYGYATRWAGELPWIYHLYGVGLDSKVHVFDEIGQAGTGVTDQIVAIKTLEQEWGVHPVYRVGCRGMFVKKDLDQITVAETYGNNDVHMIETTVTSVSNADQLILTRLMDNSIDISSRCFKLINQLASIPVNIKKPTETDPQAEDHAIETLYSFLSSRPTAPSPPRRDIFTMPNTEQLQDMLVHNRRGMF